MHVELCGIAEIDAFVSRWKLPVVPPQDPGIHFVYKLKMSDGSFITCQGEVMDSIKVGFQRTVHLSVKDKFGNLARIDGEFAIDTSMVDPAAATVVVADDKKSFTVVPTNAVIDVVGEVGVACDADLGEGVKPITGSYKFVIESGEAQAFAFSADGEVEQPAPIDPPVDPVDPTDPA